MRTTTYELEDPHEFEGKTSGKSFRTLDKLELHAPTARVFVDLEKAGLLEEGHDLEMSLVMLKRCYTGASTDIDLISMRDLEGAMRQMEEEGFFGSKPAQKPAGKKGAAKAR